MRGSGGRASYSSSLVVAWVYVWFVHRGAVLMEICTQWADVNTACKSTAVSALKASACTETIVLWHEMEQAHNWSWWTFLFFYFLMCWWMQCKSALSASALMHFCWYGQSGGAPLYMSMRMAPDGGSRCLFGVSFLLKTTQLKPVF